MKNFEEQKRQLSIKETRALQKIRSTAEKDLKKGYRFHYFLIAGITGVICVFLANRTDYDLLKFVFGTVCAFSFNFVVFMPYEIYKDQKKVKKKIKEIDGLLAQNSIDVHPVQANRSAVAKEYEDEGDLYIVEMINKDILYLEDYDYNLKKNFPCLEFEIYDNRICELIGRQINPLSEKINPVIIEAKAKWDYLKKAGSPGHLTIVKKDFEEVVKQINQGSSQ